MRMSIGTALAILVLCVCNITVLASDCVILLHGLARTDASMEKLASVLSQEGFEVVNVSYPSRQYPVEELSKIAVERGLSKCPGDGTIHFVTHSLGGILIRYYLEKNDLEGLGRVVMLAPPNQGSEVVDNLRDVPGFTLINGPAGSQLGTDKDSISSKLGPVHFELGVIAGTESMNPILSQYLPNPDDGKVSVESTKVEGMSDFITVPHSHPFVMRAQEAIKQVVSFLRTGSFIHEKP
ncbi:MAG: alpha/beta hydrolase [Gammaproteobacteria bacterium]|nr:alpha/beta hydrolase [Gammaproteobacteria bacterium]